MRKYSHIILCFLFALHLVPIHASAEEYDLMINGAKNEEEMYILLMEHKGHEILEEYIMLENEGASELISYACALADKSDEFTEEEIVQLILEERTLGETESVLVEMLHRKNADFNKLTYIQDDASVALNTKQLLLQSDAVDLEYLVSCVYGSDDFLAKTAMQQIGFRDKAYAFELSKDLLFNYDANYYRMAAVNIGMDLYYQNYPEEEKDTKEIADKLMAIYQTAEDEQIRFWAIDTLGWMQDWEVFKAVSDLTDLEPAFRCNFYDNAKEYVYERAQYAIYEEDIPYYLDYLKWTEDERLKTILENGGVDVSEVRSEASISSLSSYIGYAVYRDGVGGVVNLNHHAAIMNLLKANQTSPLEDLTNKVVIHAPGSPLNVKLGSWNEFLSGHDFVAVCRPFSCSMTTTNMYAFKGKAMTLIGISYYLLGQIKYTYLNDGSTIQPSIITNIRCDGVVEYVYEYYGYRVGGSDSYWNISINSLGNKNEHSSFNITPKKQNENLLYRVSTNSNDLFN